MITVIDYNCTSGTAVTTERYDFLIGTITSGHEQEMEEISITFERKFAVDVVE